MYPKNRQSDPSTRFGGILFFLAAHALPVSTFADSLMMTTWYPAPYGIYSQLRSTGNSYFAYQGGGVGIGTTAPSTKLQVAGDVSYSDAAGISFQSTAEGNNNGGAFSLYTSAGKRVWAVTNDGAVRGFDPAGSTQNFAIRAADGSSFFLGNMGLGTGPYQPQVKLAVMGTLDVGDTQQHYSPFGIPFYVFTHTDNTHIAHFETDQPTGRFAIKTGLGEWDFMSGADSANKFVLYNPTGAGYVLTAMNDGSIDIGGSRTTWGYKLAVEGTAANYTGVWANLSDVRLKKDIAPLTGGLSLLNQLRPVTFRWKDENKDKEYGLTRGFIAQEVESVVPDWVRTDPRGRKWLETVGINAVLVESIQEQQRQIEQQRREIDDLQKRFERLEKTLSRY